MDYVRLSKIKGCGGWINGSVVKSASESGAHNCLELRSRGPESSSGRSGHMHKLK